MPIKTPDNEAELESLLSEPYPETVDLMCRLKGDMIILGVAGKMGPSLALMAVRAAREAGVSKKIYGVARFSNYSQKLELDSAGVETIVCDLADPEAVNALPKCPNVIFMAGRKFGSVGSEALTWVMNVVVPAKVALAFRDSRIVVFSTGCVYALKKADSAGSVETDQPGPIGEYSNSCLGRERVFEHYSDLYGTPVLQYRLNYAIDLRYGVLQDIAQRIWSGQSLDRGVQAVNVIWQGDANNRALLSLEHTASPAAVLNVTGIETLAVEELGRQFGKLLDKPVTFVGQPQEQAYLSDASKSVELFGKPRVSVEQMMEWTAEWIRRGGRILGKPTHFTVTDGQFLDKLPAESVS